MAVRVFAESREERTDGEANEHSGILHVEQRGQGVDNRQVGGVSSTPPT
jgi:hypothetical protein